MQGDPTFTALLRDVSRTFFLSMRLLPPAMQPAVSLGYLLARATDSVADTSTAPAEQRRVVLGQMGAAVAGQLDSEATELLLMRLGGAMAQAQKNPAEFRLLRFFGTCLAQLAALPAAQRRLVQRVLASITEGQLWDLTAFTPEHPAVQSDEETRRYTYLVAGCVGEFWTSLGYETMGERFADPARREIMNKAAARYGQGLQLVNILRDWEEDAARGRSYLCSSPELWADRAERYLRDGVDYSCRLRGFRVRLASVLPALLGLRTLRLMRRRGLGQGKSKISRAAVYAALAEGVCRALLPAR